jgi:GntR family transcriptional regulator
MPSRQLVRPPSLSQQVLIILMEQIKSGAFPPGSQLPAEQELAAEFDVSRATIRSAMGALAARGLIVNRHGVGTFVSQLARVENPLNEATDYCNLITRQGLEFDTQFVTAEFLVPDADIAEALAIPTGEEVLRTRKIFTADSEPVIYSINSIPHWVMGDELAREVAERPQMIEPLYQFLEGRCGQRTENHIARIRPDIAENCDLQGWDVDPDTPVLVMHEVGYNNAEQPLWHSFVFFPGNFFRFEVIRRREPNT